MRYRLENVCSLNLICGEGPVWDTATNQLYFTDCMDSKIFSFSPEQGSCALLKEDMQSASITLHENGGFMVCGKEGFTYFNRENERCGLGISKEGIRADNLNEIISDAKGRVYAGQDSFTDGNLLSTGYLFMLDLCGTIRVADEGLHLANGMGFSPEADTFYLVDSIQRKIFKYSYRHSTGELSGKESLYQFDKDDGLPDGLAVDSEGFLWVALFQGSMLMRIDPDGKLNRVVRLPYTQPTSIAFGGKNMNKLFITSASLHSKSGLEPAGYDDAKDRGGSLYCLELDITGKEEYKARVNTKCNV